jgi:Tol biopolymer transport system component
MTERWQSQLESIERLHPDGDLIERIRQRSVTPAVHDGAGRRAGAIALGVLLAIGLAVGGVFVLRNRTPATNVVVAPPEVIENGNLLYGMEPGEPWHIASLDPATGIEHELTNGFRDYDSDWSPDGTQIVYDSETDAGYEIVIADADGSNPVPIADGESPSWSPDGSRIAYTLEPDGRIWIVNVDGSDAHPVTDPESSGGETVSYSGPYDWNPSWSPDGRSIAYTRLVSERLAPRPGGEGRVSVTLEELRVWSEDADVALTDAYTQLGDVDWSPDGSTIVFTGAPTLFHQEATDGIVWPRVMTMPSSGGESTPITPERDRWIHGATWSPDGEWIAFQDDDETIAIVRPDGSDRREIDVGHAVVGLSWGVRPRSG